eukprot:2290990-Karenia_brevis.AAC.1
MPSLRKRSETGKHWPPFFSRARTQHYECGCVASNVGIMGSSTRSSLQQRAANGFCLRHLYFPVQANFSEGHLRTRPMAVHPHVGGVWKNVEGVASQVCNKRVFVA